MCGRYAASANADELVLELEVDEVRVDEPLAPKYNLAPTDPAPIVLTREPRGEDRLPTGEPPVRQLRVLRWGLVPSWAKDSKGGARMINARAESVLTKGAFAKAARSRRCLVPADGYYEWQASPVATGPRGAPRKQPFFVHRRDGQRLTMAGLYEFWRDPSLDPDDPAAWLTTFAIITTAAEPGMEQLHDRQPLVLDPEQWAGWLDPDERDPDVVRGYLEGAEPGRLEAYPVSQAVNRRENGPQLLEPADPATLEGVVDLATGEIVG